MSFVIVNGFDRSGTSAISKCLSSHVDLELIMHPFNSGSIREKMYLILSNHNTSVEDRSFFNKLKNNDLDQSYIKSGWHKKHSSTDTHIPGKIHLVKTTLNHLAQKWMVEEHSELDVWGIWRDPFDNMNSILSNGFHTNWYKDALLQLAPTVENSELLKPLFIDFFKTGLNDFQKLALQFSIRTYFFLYYLESSKLIDYERFKASPTAEVSKFFKYYGLDTIDVQDYAAKDLNIIGSRLNSVGFQETLKEDSVVLEMLKPVLELYNNKFQS